MQESLCKSRPGPQLDRATAGVLSFAEASYAGQAASEAAKVAGLAAATQATRAYVGAAGTADESGLGKDEAEVDTCLFLDSFGCFFCRKLNGLETVGKKEQQHI